MPAGRMTRPVAIGLMLSLAALVAAYLLWHAREAPRPHYVLLNETANHDFDLALRMSLKLAEKKSGIENALVLLPQLPEGRTIEETAAELFSKYRIGQRRNGRGILYLYSARENLMKIEVSYALEAEIPDAVCRHLEEAAKTYMLSEVPQDFISELIITTNLRGAGSRDEAAPAAAPAWLNAAFLSGGAGARVVGYRRSLEDYDRAIRQLADARLDDYAASSDAGTTAQRYLMSLAAGIGDPRLPLLTQGSRIFRAIVPRDEAQQKRIFEFLQAAMPHRLLFAGDLALVVPQPGKSNLPLVLRRGTDGLWYVDEPKAWAYFHRFEDDVNFHVKYADNEFLPALRTLGLPNMQRSVYGTHVGTPPREAYPFSLIELTRSLEERARAAPSDAEVRAALGDLYLFEMNWISRAIEWYEAAQTLAPQNLTYRWRLMDLYLNASRADKSLEELAFLSAHLPQDSETRQWYDFYKKAYTFDP